MPGEVMAVFVFFVVFGVVTWHYAKQRPSRAQAQVCVPVAQGIRDVSRQSTSVNPEDVDVFAESVLLGNQLEFARRKLQAVRGSLGSHDVERYDVELGSLGHLHVLLQTQCFSGHVSTNELWLTVLRLRQRIDSFEASLDRVSDTDNEPPPAA